MRMTKELCSAQKCDFKTTHSMLVDARDAIGDDQFEELEGKMLSMVFDYRFTCNSKPLDFSDIKAAIALVHAAAMIRKAVRPASGDLP